MNARFGNGTDHAMAAIASARRAVAVERWSAIGLDVEVVPLATLGAMTKPWSALAACAVEPDVFLEPAFAMAAMPIFGDGAQAGLIWSQSSPRELLGIFPIRIEHWRYGLPLPVLTGWTHPFAPFGVPLVHRDVAEPVISAWLDHIVQDASLPSLMLLPYVCDDGGFATVFDGVLARRGCAMASFDRHQRALLAPGEDRDGYIERAIAIKQRRELARKWRRLQDLGAAEIIRATEPADVLAQLDDFFRIEASGWKGRIGTAAAKDDDIRRFMAEVVSALVPQDQATIRCLKVGGQAIAAAITLNSGNTAWGWKIAYDEAYARFSPGVQLLVQLTQDLLADTSIIQVDSTATANHPMIDHIWRERRTMSDRLIAVKPHALMPFSVVSGLETLRRRSRDGAKALRDRLRARHRPDNTVTRAGATADE